MTTLFMPDEIDYLRANRKTAIILIAMGMLDRRLPGRAVKVAEMADALDMDVRTVEKHMQSLSARGRLIFDGRGYVLTEGGRAPLLGSTIDENHEAPKVQAPETKALAPEALETVNADENTDDIRSAGVQADTQNAMHTMCALEEERRDINLEFNNISSSSKSAKNAQTQPTARQILEMCRGMEGFIDGIDLSKIDLSKITARMAIAWVAHAYDQRIRDGRAYGIKTPSWFVVSKLRDVNMPKPEIRYWEHPRDYLPDGYLEALGLARTYACPNCEATFSRREALEDHSASHLAQDDETERPALSEWAEQVVVGPVVDVHALPASDCPIVDAADVWDMAKQAMRANMPPASYDTWLGDTVGEDIHDDVLTVRARNSFTQCWLEARLTERASAIVGTMLGQQVTVRFVVSCEETE